MNEYLFYYGDIIEVQEDILTFDGKRQARAGQIGEVRDMTVDLYKHIWVKLEGNGNNSELAAWKLKIVKKKMKRAEKKLKIEAERIKANLKNWIYRLVKM